MPYYFIRFVRMNLSASYLWHHMSIQSLRTSAMLSLATSHEILWFALHEILKVSKHYENSHFTWNTMVCVIYLLLKEIRKLVTLGSRKLVTLGLRWYFQLMSNSPGYNFFFFFFFFFLFIENPTRKKIFFFFFFWEVSVM